MKKVAVSFALVMYSCFSFGQIDSENKISSAKSRPAPLATDVKKYNYYIARGDTMLGAANYQLALQCYKIALEWNPNGEYAKLKIREIEARKENR